MDDFITIQKQGYTTTINKLRQQLDEKKNVCATLDDELDAVTQENYQLAQDTERYSIESDLRVKQMTDHISQVQQQNQALRQKAADIQASQELKLEQLRQQLAEQCEQLLGKRAENELLIKQLSKEVIEQKTLAAQFEQMIEADLMEMKIMRADYRSKTQNLTATFKLKENNLAIEITSKLKGFSDQIHFMNADE